MNEDRNKLPNAAVLPSAAMNAPERLMDTLLNGGSVIDHLVAEGVIKDSTKQDPRHAGEE